MADLMYGQRLVRSATPRRSFLIANIEHISSGSPKTVLHAPQFSQCYYILKILGNTDFPTKNSRKTR